MMIREMMKEPPVTVPVHSSLQKATEIMDGAGLGILPVCDGENRLVGSVNGLDLIARKTTDGKLFDKVADVMIQPMLYVFEDQDTAEAAQVMNQTNMHRLSVLDREWHVVGSVSRAEVAAVEVIDRQEGGNGSG